MSGASDGLPRLAQYHLGRYSRLMTPPCARYWLTKFTASVTEGSDVMPFRVSVSMSSISGVEPTTEKAWSAWPAPLPACRK